MNTLKTEVPKERLAGEFDAVLDKTEQLLKTVSQAGRAEAGALTASVEHGFATAAARLEQMRVDALARAGSAAEVTDRYVHSNPWQAVGIVAAAAAAAGLLAGILISRR
jgi:ElaB/YqjD/DUF883 family membrane-anchored ribosome-binding protein